MTESDSITVAPSRIEGLGLFARRSFEAGERIHEIVMAREVTPDAPLRADRGERVDHCEYPDGKVILIGFPSRHLNHSCDPNSYLRYEGAACDVVARRHVASGDEVTVDYNINISGGTAWPCRCGSPRCSGTVVGDYFLLPPKIQHEYRPLLASWFVRRHAARLAAHDTLAVQ